MIAFNTIVLKEVVRFMRIWIQTIVPSVVTTTLYFVIFGHVIGSRIGMMDGYTYMQYITPGLIMMSVITNSYANVSGSFFSLKFQRSVEELLVAPIPNYIILLGFVGGGVLRGLVVGFCVTMISMFFSHLELRHVFIMFSVVFLSALLFSIAGFINALYAKKFDDVSLVPTFVLTPLTYLGGVFYSISLLPTIWQVISKANPIVYMVNAFRFGFLGLSDVSVYFAFGMLFAFVIVLYLIALYLLRKGVGLRA